MEIREATSDDAPAIAQVHVDSWLGAYRGIVADEILDNLSVERRTDGWRNNLLSGDSWVFVAEERGKVCGFVACGSIERSAGDDEFAGFEAAETAELAAIYVAPSAWGSGVGRALMERATDDLRSRGFSSAVLWVLEGNDRAIRFYEDAGWKHDGGRKSSFGRSASFQAPAVRYAINL